MALIDRWRRQAPWVGLGLAGLGAGLLGPIGSIAGMLPWTVGSASSPRNPKTDHPLRQRILQTLEGNPGLAYRELQGTLATANGTLRHHLDVLIGRGDVTVMPVNGRSCHFAGHPAQAYDLRGVSVGEEELRRIVEQHPHGLSLLQRLIVESLTSVDDIRSQADLARYIGRSRTSVHSAIKVLRRRGIVDMNRLALAPHLCGERHLSQRPIDYEWDDERQIA